MSRTRRIHLWVWGLAIGMYAMVGAFLWLHLTSPFDGARLGPEEPFVESAWKNNGIFATPLQEEADGLRKNDLVVAVDGIGIETWAQALTSLDFRRPQWKDGQRIIYSVVRDGRSIDIPVRLRPYPLGAVLISAGLFPVSVLIFQFITLYLFWRRPDDAAVRTLAVCGSCGSTMFIYWAIGLQMSDIVGGVGFWLFKAGSFTTLALAMFGVIRFALVFPQRHPILSKGRLILWSIYAAPAIAYSVYLVIAAYQAPSRLAWLAVWNSSWMMIPVMYLVLAAITLVSNHLRTIYSSPIARQQRRLVVFSMATAQILGLVVGLLPRLLLGHILIDRNMMSLLPLIFLSGLTIAILRYRLFDIDIVINRTLVYAGLTGIVITIYALTVGLLGAVFEASGNLTVSLCATGLVALLFQPLRLRLQRAVNRLMYGERDDPYSVLARLGQRLEATLTPNSILPTIVETIAQALKLPYAAIAIRRDGGFEEAAAYGLLKSEPLRLPLAYQGETLGQLILAPRGPGEPFTPADLRLLESVTYQIGIAIHAVQLTIDLARTRQQLVSAREEERRRLRRDLHDGLGQALASQALQLDVVHNLVQHDPKEAQLLIEDLKGQTQEVIADIRRLVYELRPPALDELGLVSALREHIGQLNHFEGLSVSLEAPECLPTLPAAVEVAAYRIALEALTNVVRHARARRCAICLTLEQALCLSVTDDGCGIHANQHAGVGLTSMRERAVELGGMCHIQPAPGGGTHVLVRLPLPKEKAD